MYLNPRDIQNWGMLLTRLNCSAFLSVTAGPTVVLEEPDSVAAAEDGNAASDERNLLF